MKKTRFNAYTLSFMGVMIAIIYVVTMFRFPLLGSKVHFANSMCLLSGLLFGPQFGALALQKFPLRRSGGKYHIYFTLDCKQVTYSGSSICCCCSTHLNSCMVHLYLKMVSPKDTDIIFSPYYR